MSASHVAAVALAFFSRIIVSASVFASTVSAMTSTSKAAASAYPPT